jgi:hypothetical protein
MENNQTTITKIATKVLKSSVSATDLKSVGINGAGLCFNKV